MDVKTDLCSDNVVGSNTQIENIVLNLQHFINPLINTIPAYHFYYILWRNMEVHNI